MNLSKKSALISTITAVVSLVVITQTSHAQAYNAAGDFSLAGNPNGAWSYGWSTTLGSAFNLDSSNTTAYSGVAGLSGWLSSLASDGSPLVLHNGTASPHTTQNTTLQPGQLALGPGFFTQYSIVRWTAPTSGSFTINATFSGLSSLGDSSDVHILHDGVSIFDANINGSPSPASYSGLQSILPGDTLDFVVGVGINGNYNEDITGLSATIVPEPGSLALAAMGVASLLFFGFRKQN